MSSLHLPLSLFIPAHTAHMHLHKQYYICLVLSKVTYLNMLDTGEDAGDKAGQFYRQWRAAGVRLTP
jgi:hypothetical protein